MSDPVVSAQFIRHIANCLELTGRPAAPLLHSIGLSRAELDDPEGVIRLADFLLFFEEAAALARNPYFGLHVGRLVGSDSLGPLSFLFLSAPTLREAFASFTRYLDRMQEASRDAIQEHSGRATFEYAVLDQSLSRRRQDAEYSIAATYNLTRQYLGGDFAIEEVRFEHELVGEYTHYRDYFGCDVWFEQDSNSFSFDVRYLDHCGRALSPALHPILEDHLRRKPHEQQHRATVGAKVRRAIEARPLGNKPSIASVAKSLGLSVPTLNRKLRAEGLTWHAIVSANRMMAAGRLLRESQRQISDIALATGFAESASFTRAFRGYFGITPLRYRQGEAPTKEHGTDP
ncbi:MAG: AraC family transcriptional regulator [Novosphingobium sp.]